jgi:hypothetical protein
MAFAQELVRCIERFSALDKVAGPVADLVGKAVRPRAVRNLLSGTSLGHPAHPMLTDFPIGAWSMSAVLDAVGGASTERAADLLVGAGILGAIPTAATGLNDWSDTIGGERRIGLVHASANVVALSLYVASLLARRSGGRGAGKVLGLAGLGVLVVGAYLGGHLTFAKAVNVNHTLFEHRPQEWTTVLAEAELGEGELRRVSVGEASVVLVRDDGRVYALASTSAAMPVAHSTKASSSTAAWSARGTPVLSGLPTATSCAAQLRSHSRPIRPGSGTGRSRSDPSTDLRDLRSPQYSRLAFPRWPISAY